MTNEKAIAIAKMQLVLAPSALSHTICRLWDGGEINEEQLALMAGIRDDYYHAQIQFGPFQVTVTPEEAALAMEK